MNLPKTILQIKEYLISVGFPEVLDAAVILGSGLGGFGSEIETPKTISYADIPGLPQSTVTGHSGALIVGKIAEKTVLAFSGRSIFMKDTVLIRLSYRFNWQKLLMQKSSLYRMPRVELIWIFGLVT